MKLNKSRGIKWMKNRQTRLCLLHVTSAEEKEIFLYCIIPSIVVCELFRTYLELTRIEEKKKELTRIEE